MPSKPMTYRQAFDELKEYLLVYQRARLRDLTLGERKREEALAIALKAMVAHSGCFVEKDQLYESMVPKRKKGVLRR
jgi:hypothetical protein